MCGHLPVVFDKGDHSANAHRGPNRLWNASETHLRLNMIQLCGTVLIIRKVWGDTQNVMQFY